jgi:urease accessory protein
VLPRPRVTTTTVALAVAEDDHGTDDGALLRLLTWLSPAFPVGGYAFSHGLETAIADGLIGDAEALREWVGAAVRQGSGRSDGALLAAAWRALRGGDGAELAAVAERGEVFRPTAELALESRAQGKAFLAAVAAAWPGLFAGEAGLLAPLARREPPPAYAVAVGAAAAAAGLPLRPVLLGFLAAFAASLVSAGVRLLPLGQTQGLRVLAALEPTLAATADLALATAISELASATWMLDLCSARHETQTVRLFRS